MNSITLFARLSLAFLWIFTALTSAFLDRESGYQILALSHIEGNIADLFINAGSTLDIIIGIWLISGYQLKLVCWLQILIIITYTTLLSFIAPVYWLHPFGPVTKNVPLLVMIYWLIIADSSIQIHDLVNPERD